MCVSQRCEVRKHGKNLPIELGWSFLLKCHPFIYPPARTARTRHCNAMLVACLNKKTIFLKWHFHNKWAREGKWGVDLGGQLALLDAFWLLLS